MTKPAQKPIESKEAEQTVLGSLLVNPKNFEETREKIHPEDFYYENHQIIFQGMMDLEESGAPIDLPSLTIRLKESDLLTKAGGPIYLAELSEAVGFATNLPHFVEIVCQKSMLRRLSVLAAKTYQACFNGHKPSELIVKLQEKLADLAAHFGGSRKSSKVALNVREWINISPGSFEVRQIYNDLGILSGNDKKSVLMALTRLEKDGLIEKIPGRRGWYRTIEKEADKIDFLHADPGNWLDVKFPLGIDKYVKLYPTNIIIVAGEKGSGKTAFCLDTARLNIGQFPVRYLSSEMAAEELRTRLEAFDMPIKEWAAVDFRSRRDNFADLIDPDAVNIIDFLEKYDQFWSVGADIRSVFDKLNKGICIIAIQKDKGAESGRGGMFTREKCRLHVALGNHEARIDDVKIFKMPGYNPNGLVMKYKLIDGARFQLVETVFDAPRQSKRGNDHWNN